MCLHVWTLLLTLLPSPRTHLHICTCTHTHTHVSIHTYTHTYTLTTHTHTYTRTYIHAHTYTHKHTHRSAEWVDIVEALPVSDWCRVSGWITLQWGNSFIAPTLNVIQNWSYWNSGIGTIMIVFCYDLSIRRAVLTGGRHALRFYGLMALCVIRLCKCTHNFCF